MKEKTYSTQIANAITDYLDKDDWRYSFNEKTGIYRFGLSLKGKLKKITYIIDVKDDEYLVYAISPLGADENDDKMMANMAEFICRANYGMKMGNFEMDFQDGEIRFKVHICCKGITPNDDMIKRSIYCPATVFDHYSSGIMDVLFHDVSGKDAVERCEATNESQLRGLLTGLLGDDNSDGDMESLISRFAQRFGMENNDEDAEDTETESRDILTDLFDPNGGTDA